ncbi:ppiB [Symbiodinium sp. KB8]|nr:ppiB [Symbiodinium sp. KB8]
MDDTTSDSSDSFMGRGVQITRSGDLFSDAGDAASQARPSYFPSEAAEERHGDLCEGGIGAWPDSAPITVEYIVKAIKAGLYDNKSFYRSDFVIQCGLHGSGEKPPGDLSKNETRDGVFVSNVRGTCAVAHWDVPDNGNTEFFINLQANAHLDTAYGGYCVFAEVADEASFTVADEIARVVKAKGSVKIKTVHEAEAKAAGQKLLMTGHSLGGALVGAASAAHGVDGIGFSPPGLYYQVQKFDLTLADLQSTFAIVQPANDVVPRVDKQRGMIQWIQCLESAAQCHRLTHTACELWARCGDSSKRDWRQTCSRWYSGGPNGDINQEL